MGSDVSRYVYGVVCFFVIVRNLRVFSWTSVYKLHSKALRSTVGPICGFLLLHIVVVIAFASFAALIYGSGTIFELRDFWRCFLFTIFNRWWKSGAAEMVHILHHI